MIRMVLIVVGFLACTITLIIIQPDAPMRTAGSAADSLPVTRADTGLEAAEAMMPANATQTQASRPDPLPQTTEGSALERMVIEALRQGQSDEYIDALVNHAAKTGMVEVPGALVTEDGSVDTTTLLTVLSKAPDAMRHGARLYEVRPGDSLASISFRFYGTTDKAPAIFAANEAVMGSPRNIAVGQELVIPAQ